MTPLRLDRHPRVRVVLLVLMLLAVLAVRALGRQAPPMSSREVRAVADTTQQLRVVVSIAARWLWVIGSGGDTLRSAPVAVGSGRRFSLGGRTWLFATPTGIRKVLSVEVDPLWIRPDWAYGELARQRKLRLDSVSVRRPHGFTNGDSLVVRGQEIGVVRSAAFTPWAVDRDVVIGRVLYMPPIGSPYRASAGVLGRYRLNLGSSVGIHGTQDKTSIGRAVTHGCLRLGDHDLEWVYLNVPVGTLVFIY